jgi:hypothetical protein
MRFGKALPLVFCLLILLISTGLICDDPEEVSIDRVDGGYLYDSSFAAAPDGSLWMVGVQARSIVAYHDTGPGVETYDVALSGSGPDVAVDANGFVHIAYFDVEQNRLGYITNLGGDWETAFPDDTPSIAYHPAIAVDDTGVAHIAYQGEDNHLRIATNRSGDWEWTVVDPTADIREMISIAVDTSGNAHLCYSDVDVFYYSVDVLNYSTEASGTWTTEQVYDYGGVSMGHNSIAIGPGGQVKIAFQEDLELLYAEKNAGVWTTSVLDRNVIGFYSISYPSLKIDDLGHAHVAYALGYLPSAKVYPTYTISYITDASGVWEKEPDIGESSTEELELVLDPSGKPIVGYRCLNGYNQIKVIAKEPSGWVEELLADGEFLGIYTGIAVGPNNKLHAVYKDHRNDLLVLARLEPTGWEYETVARASDYPEARPAIALDSSGAIHIAFWNAFPTEFIYATNSSGAWVMTTLEPGAHRIENPELSIDGDGAIHIAYPSRDANDDTVFKYATNASGSWVTEEAVPAGEAFQYFDFTLGPDGTPYLSFCNGHYTGPLVLAVRETTGWSQGFIHRNNGQCYSNEIAVDQSGTVHAISTSHTGAELYYSEKPGRFWRHTTFVLPGLVEHVDLAINSAGGLHIVYFDRTANELIYRSYLQGQWNTAPIDNIGTIPRIALDSLGSVHLGYTGNSSHGALWHASFPQGFVGF